MHGRVVLWELKPNAVQLMLGRKKTAEQGKSRARQAELLGLEGEVNVQGEDQKKLDASISVLGGAGSVDPGAGFCRCSRMMPGESLQEHWECSDVT